ncbi:hypothetical protein GCM10028825_13690 [Spirosoma agri]
MFPKSWEGRQAMIVSKPLRQSPIIDTTTIFSRSAVFTINLPEPSPAYLWVEGHKDDVQFFIDSPEIGIGFSPDATGQRLITGSPSSELWAEQINTANSRNTLPDSRSDTFTALMAGDSALALSLEKIADSLRLADNNATASLIRANPALASSWYLFASTDFSFAQSLVLFDALSAFSAYPSYKAIKEKIARKRLGNKAPAFTSLTASGESISPSTVKSKCILLDFHSSYLVACQIRHLGLRELYKKYHSLGLKIITVTFEFDKAAGEAAMAKARLPWIHVLDTMPSSSIISAFAIDRMPDNVLLDSTKTMIGRDLSVPELDARLGELLKN